MGSALTSWFQRHLENITSQARIACECEEGDELVTNKGQMMNKGKKTQMER